MKIKIALLITVCFFRFMISALPIPHTGTVGCKVQHFTLNNSSGLIGSLPPVDIPPVAHAGADTVIYLPVDTISLSGCLSSDPEDAQLSFKWLKISGPGAIRISADTLCFVHVKGLTEGTYSFELAVTDTAGLTAKDTVVVVVNSIFNAAWPVQAGPLCNSPFKVVVLGSSTTYGYGADPVDSSWVNKFEDFVLQQNAQSEVINLSYPGYNSYNLSPTGTVIPSNMPFSVDIERNITKALSLNPDAIIINLPSNDVVSQIPFADILFNYNRIQAVADSQQVPVWITTTQPRNLDGGKLLLQRELRDWIMNRFENKAIDFWSTVSDSVGNVRPAYSAGDGIHLNNDGHHVLFTRVIEERIWDTICLRKNLKPVAIAGNDTTVTATPAIITLNGSLSFDLDGAVVSYNWNILNSTQAAITGASTEFPVFSTSVPMSYLVELAITDNLGGVSKDTIQITVNPVAVTTYTFNGSGNWDVAANWENNLIPPAILSGNAMIIIAPMAGGECVLNVSQQLTNGSILKVMENKKFRVKGKCEISR